jgi:hypothetical protein
MTKDEKIKAAMSCGFPASDALEWYKRYYGHTVNAQTRGLKSNLTFDQYLVKLKEAEITHTKQLGSYSGQFHLGRVGDVGNYEINTCRFITSNQNHREAFENGRMDSLHASMRGQTKENSERAKKISIAHVGRTAETHAYIAERALTQRGRTKETHQYLADKGSKITEAKAKVFVLTDPDGIEHRGKTLHEFAKKNKITPSGLAGVCRGLLKQHKGWTGRYENESNSV